MLTQPIASDQRATVIDVLSRYKLPIGDIEIERDVIGFTNAIFIISVGRKKFVLCESNSRTQHEHIKFEVEVLGYLQAKGFKLTPKIISSKKGKFITILNGRYYILQNFLPGEDKASWNNLRNFNIGMVRSFFSATAKFTRAANGFKTKRKIESKPLYSLIKNGRAGYLAHMKKMPDSPGKRMVMDQNELILKLIKKIEIEVNRCKYALLPKQIVHFDLHPGNVNFVGNKVSGLFDFDLVRFDTRISDIAVAISMATYWFGGTHAGLYRKDRIREGLRAYRKAYGKSEFTLPRENELIKIALKVYIFELFIWSLDWYTNHHKERNSEEVVRQFLNALTLNDFDNLFS
jgi:Ser/Thr protein kinase RdoA (MazF antagonist)